MEYEGIENHLKNVSNAYAHFTLFETTAEFTLISSSLESILRSSSSLEGFNETLKLILSTLIDSIWVNLSNPKQSGEVQITEHLKEMTKEHKPEIKDLKGSQKSLSRCDSRYEPLRYQDLQLVSKSEEHHFSTESIHLKYAREKRFLGHRRESSHNFSDPYNNIDYVLPASPKISFPREARKFSLGNPVIKAGKFG
jgi:hypothetical protein